MKVEGLLTYELSGRNNTPCVHFSERCTVYVTLYATMTLSKKDKTDKE